MLPRRIILPRPRPRGLPRPRPLSGAVTTAGDLGRDLGAEGRKGGCLRMKGIGLSRLIPRGGLTSSLELGTGGSVPAFEGSKEKVVMAAQRLHPLKGSASKSNWE